MRHLRLGAFNDGSAGLRSKPCFTSLHASLVVVAAYVNLEVCQQHGEACTAGSDHCSISAVVACPIGNEVKKFNRCSGLKFDSGASPDYKADVTFPYPRPVAVSAEVLQPRFCSIPELTELETRINHVSMSAVITAAGTNTAATRSKFDLVYNTYYGAEAKYHFACERCLTPWMLFRYQLTKGGVQACADLSSNDCLSLVAKHHDAMVTCAVGSNTKCSAAEVSAIRSASPPLDVLTSAILSVVTNDPSRAEAAFMSAYTNALLAGTDTNAARTKGCFNCWTDRARALLPLLANAGVCVTAGPGCEASKAAVETNFQSCENIHANAGSAPPAPGDEPAPETCSVVEYVALQEAINKLDIEAIVSAATSLDGFTATVVAAITGDYASNPFEGLPCYACEQTRMEALYPAVTNANGDCHDGFHSAACMALLDSVKADLETCMKAAVNGALPTITAKGSGVSSMTMPVVLFAMFVANV